jgi:hypothetical protein
MDEVYARSKIATAYQPVREGGKFGVDMEQWL